jgi:uncharacterized protein (TIGR04255 family)
MTNYPVLTTTPIKEIIFTISYSETIAPEVLADFRNQKDIIEKYGIVRDGFKTRVVAAEGVKPETSIKSDGYILKCEKENKVIQAREGSFAFHKVNGYEEFDKLLSELFYLWNTLLECNKGKLSIQGISLRYLNFIELNNTDNMAELIKVKPLQPFSEKLDNYFMQLKFTEKEYQITLVTTAPILQDMKKGLVLDSILNKLYNKSTDYSVIRDDFIAMREIKNRLFFESITDYTLNKFL